MTPFQAMRVERGPGPQLRAGPYVLCQPQPACDYLPCYRARHGASGEIVRLAVVEPEPDRAAEMLRQIEGLAAASAELAGERFGAGTGGGPPMAGGCGSPPTGVMQGPYGGPMAGSPRPHDPAPGLGGRPGGGRRTGGPGTSRPVPRRREPVQPALAAQGSVLLAQPGLRGIVRPEEGYARADLRPEAYATLAPERIAGRHASRHGQRPVRLGLRLLASALRPAAARRRRQPGHTAGGTRGGDRRRAAIGAGRSRRIGGRDCRMCRA